MVKDFSKIITDVASPLFKREFINNKPTKVEQNAWYDKECAEHKKNVKNSIK